MTCRYFMSLFLAGAALSLAACGGGGGGSHVAFTPTPPPAPGSPPSPLPPAPTSPIPPPHIGLVSSAPFAVQAVAGQSFADVQFTHDPASNTYQITLPGFVPGTLVNTSYGGTVGQLATSSFSQIEESAFGGIIGTVNLPVPGSSFSPYTYTSFGEWHQPTGPGNSSGIFAYGIPTAAGNVPVTGSASYTAQIHASTDLVPDFEVTGAVNLLFNFGGGTLSGSMHPEIADSFDGVFVDFGQFAFTQTVYSIGSTTFSGKFIVPGLPGADSSFNGNFTGPNAAELMARFTTPVVLDNDQGTLSGIWVGEKN